LVDIEAEHEIQSKLFS